MTVCVDIIPEAIAVYETTDTHVAGSGGVMDDAPLLNPVANLDKLKYHSDFDYMEVAFRGTATISHAAVAHSGYSTSAGSAAGSGITIQPSSWRASPAVATHTLYTHNLGYKPQVMVKIGDDIITPGFSVQTNTANGIRLVTVIVTDTQIQLREQVWTWAGTLAAVSRTYEVLGFLKASPTVPGTRMDIVPGSFIAGEAIIDSTRRYLREGISGEDRFYAVSGKTADASNGVVRTVSPTGTTTEDAVFTTTDYNYDGTFTSPNAKAFSIADSDELDGETYTDMDEGRLLVVDEGHVVLDSNRSMAKIVEEVNLTDVDLVFPNPTQDNNTWFKRDVFTVGTSFIATARGFCTQATWTPQEWSNRIVLATLSTDKANFLLGNGRCSRTVNPAQVGGGGTVSISGIGEGGDSGWQYASLSGYRDIQKGVPENTYMALNGTLLVEFYYMFRRTVTFAIEDDELVANLQMSIGGYATNNSTYRGPDGLSYSSTNLGVANREVIARVHRIGGRLQGSLVVASFPDGASNYHPGRTGGSPSPVYNFASTWRFQNLNFLIGHV